MYLVAEGSEHLTSVQGIFHIREFQHMTREWRM